MYTTENAFNEKMAKSAKSYFNLLYKNTLAMFQKVRKQL
jgi:hypothetical protein